MSTPVSFSYFGTKLTIVMGIVSAVLIVTLVTVFGINPNQPRKGSFGATEYPASLNSLAAGCGDFFLFEPTEEQYAYIPDDVIEEIVEIPTHPMIVPVYGYMSETPLTDDQIRFYDMDELETPIPLETILRTMYEKNTTVIWYDEGIAFDDYTVMRSYVNQTDNVLAVKWDYKDAALPLDRNVAFSKWGISQSCVYWTDETFESFIAFTNEHPIDRAAEPPVAEVSDKNTLPPPITQT